MENIPKTPRTNRTGVFAITQALTLITQDIRRVFDMAEAAGLELIPDAAGAIAEELTQAEAESLAAYLTDNGADLQLLGEELQTRSGRQRAEKNYIETIAEQYRHSGKTIIDSTLDSMADDLERMRTQERAQERRNNEGY